MIAERLCFFYQTVTPSATSGLNARSKLQISGRPVATKPSGVCVKARHGVVCVLYLSYSNTYTYQGFMFHLDIDSKDGKILVLQNKGWQ